MVYKMAKVKKIKMESEKLNKKVNSHSSKISKPSKKLNKSISEKIVDSYANFISKYPLIIMALAIIFIFISIDYSSQIKNVGMDNKDILPRNYDIIDAQFDFSDSFGTTDSVRIVLQVDPHYKNSNEPRDIRHYEIFEYVERLSNYILTSESVESATTPTDNLKSLSNGIIPKNKYLLNKIISDNYDAVFSESISDNYEMMVINYQLSEDYDSDELVDELEGIINNVEKPVGLDVRVGGSSVTDYYINKELGGDMSKTSSFSMIGIIVLLIVVFGSLKYGLLPLVTIIVGIIWTFGYIGFMKIGMSSATSGVLSMMIGIGIDFGIQVVNRFRQEKQIFKENLERAMRHTLNAVIVPMFTTTLAAVIGFKSMSLGQISIMADMGNMMMYGVIGCFLAAISVLPAFTIILEKFSMFLAQKLGKNDKV